MAHTDWATHEALEERWAYAPKCAHAPLYSAQLPDAIPPLAVHEPSCPFEEGLAILAKGEVVAVEDFYCTAQQTVTSIESRKILKVDLKVNDEIIEFYSCHMNLPTCKGEDIDQNLSNLINYTDNKNLKVFMGDFNTDYFHQVDDYKNILDKGLFDTYELAEKKDSGVTVYKNISGWEDSMCQKKLDYVFINKKLDVKESFVIFNDENYPIISDHNGLEVTLAEK